MVESQYWKRRGMDPEGWGATLELIILRNSAPHWGGEILQDFGSRQCASLDTTSMCPCCQQSRIALLPNTCGHAACAKCWGRRVEEQLPKGEEQTHDFHALCCESGCGVAISWGLVRGICVDYSEAVRCHVASVDATFRAQEKRRLCERCGKRSYDFRTNPSCDHAFCEGCWLSYVEAESSVDIDLPALPCLHSNCSELISGCLESRLCHESESFRSLCERGRAVIQCTAPAGVPNVDALSLRNMQSCC